MNKIDLCAFPSKNFWLLEKINEPINPIKLSRPLFHAALFHATNAERKKHGLPALVYSDTLKVSALLHSAEMKIHKFFSHENPNNRSLYQLQDRVRAAGGEQKYQIIGENLADFPIVRDDFPTPQIFKPFIRALRGSNPEYETYKLMALKITEGWMNSEGHRRNILNRLFQHVGFGVAHHTKYINGTEYDYILCTQNFGKPFKS